MSEKNRRKILLYSDYFEDFYKRHAKEIRIKIDETLGAIQELNNVSEKIFKEIENTDGLYEILIKAGKNEIQIFCFLDEEDAIILQTGFRKRLNK